MEKTIKQTQKQEIPKVETVNSSDKVNQVISEASVTEIENNMVNYLKVKGYVITPSGNQVKESLVKRATTSVIDTGVGTGHIVRGMFRSIKNKITGTVTELKELGE